MVVLLADTLSILTMEIVDNAVLLAVPGAMEAGLLTGCSGASLAFALAVAFVVTVPVNRALIARGKGHARDAPVHARPRRARRRHADHDAHDHAHPDQGDTATPSDSAT